MAGSLPKFVPRRCQIETPIRRYRFGRREEFVAGFRRVFGANKWVLFGCIDSIPPSGPTNQKVGLSLWRNALLGDILSDPPMLEEQPGSHSRGLACPRMVLYFALQVRREGLGSLFGGREIRDP